MPSVQQQIIRHTKKQEPMAHSKGEKNSTESFPEKDQINCIKDAQELQEDMEKVKRTIYEQNKF